VGRYSSSIKPCSSKDKKRESKEKKKKKDKKQAASSSHRQSQTSAATAATAATAQTPASQQRDCAKFKKEARQMFAKMAASIDLGHALPNRHDG
jgi:hypothetical protein